MPVTNLPVSQSAGQQSLPGTVSVTQPAFNPPAPTADPEKKKLIQQRLVLLLHAHKCQRRENQSNGEVRQCSLPHCRTMKHVLSHMTTCQAGKSCTVPHCSSSRQIISHWKNCTKCDCPVCLPFKELPLKEAPDRQQQVAATVQTDQTIEGLAIADIERAYAALGLPLYAGNGSANINPLIQRSQTVAVPQGSWSWSPEPILQNGASGAMASQTAQNFLLADYLQPKVKTGNGALINPPPVVPGGLPDNPATVKDWHQSVTQDLRHDLVQKIVQAIFPTNDILTLQDPRMTNIVAYACKVEGDMYGAANSKEEYYQLLAEKIYKIQKELEEKRQKRKEMKLQQMQQVGPNLGPIIGGNSGTSSPRQQSPDECVLCCEESVNCAFNPCGHMKWCYRCAFQLSVSASPRCPICGEFIENILRIYMS